MVPGKNINNRDQFRELVKAWIDSEEGLGEAVFNLLAACVLGNFPVQLNPDDEIRLRGMYSGMLKEAQQRRMVL